MPQRGYPEVDSWVTAIYGAATGGMPIGSGVVIDDRRVLTCAHVVVNVADGLWAEFPLADAATIVRCRVASAATPGGVNEDQDVAILELADPIPDGVEPARLRRPTPKSLIGTDWWALGFPPAQPRGSVSTGEVGAALARGWVRIDVTSTYRIEPGFSGAGLWSPEFEAVVGIVGVYDEERNGQALTIYQADKCLPDHGLRELAELSSAEDSGELALKAWGVSPAAGPKDPRPVQADHNTAVDAPEGSADPRLVQAGRDAYAAGHDITINFYPPGGEAPPGGAVPEADGWSLAKDPEGRRHWRPRARGVAIDSEKGYRFCGRTAALAEIKTWLDRKIPDRRVLVVTGNPGAGKSAVLGRIVTTADKDAAARLPEDDTSVRATEGSVACAVHAKGATSLEVAKQIARAASAAIPDDIEDFPPALRDALTDRVGHRFNVVIDALDESTEPRAVIAKVILPLAETCHDVGVQVVVGSRRNDSDGDLLAAFGGATHLVDLDAPQYFAQEDLAAYAHAMLRLAGDLRQGNPYNQDELALPLAERIAQLSHPNFLVAGLIARTHGLSDDVAIDPAALQFNPRVDDAMREYLERIPRVAGVSADTLLLPLAYAEPPGLPVSLWRVALKALGGSDVDEVALRRFARSAAASFMVESSGDGGNVEFRLFHQALDDALLRTRAQFVEPLEDDQALTRAFLTFGQEAGWDHSPAYLLRSLPTHAARAGKMDDLLADDHYLLYADLLRVLALADRATSAVGRLRARMLRLSPRAVAMTEASQRAAIFSVTEMLESLGDVYTRTNTSTPYLAEWATASPSTGHSIFRGHYGGVNAVCTFAIDGSVYLATSGDDRTIRIWDPSTGTQVRTLTGHLGAVWSICALTLDGTTCLATAGNETTIRIWDPAVGTQVRTLTGQKGAVRSICALTLDGTTCLATASKDRGIRIWDTATGAQVRTLTGHKGAVRSICALTLDGTTCLATASDDQTIRIWDAAAGNQIRVLAGHRGGVRSICALTLDGTACLASGGNDGTIRIWNPASHDRNRVGIVRHDVLTGHNKAVRSICALTLDGITYLATAGDDHTVRIWNPANRKRHDVLIGHNSGVRSICALTVNSTTRLATASLDNTARIWDPATRRRYRSILTGHDSEVWSACTLPINGTTCLATGGNEHSVEIWDAATGTLIRTLTGHNSGVRSACTLPINGTTCLATASLDHTVRVWDPAAGTLIRTLTGHEGVVRSVCMLTLGGTTYLATASADGTVRVWDPAAGTLIRTLTGHKGTVWPVCALTINGVTCLATGGDDHTVRIWDAGTGGQIRTLTGHDKALRSICALAVNSTTTRLATTGDDRTVRIWDPATGTHIRTLTGHNSGVRSACTLPINGIPCLATGGNDGTVRVWDPATAINVAIIPTRDPALSIAYADELLYVGTKAGLLAIRLDRKFLGRTLRYGRHRIPD